LSALEVVYDDALYKSTFTLLYFTTTCAFLFMYMFTRTGKSESTRGW